jgi:hypothetical protein
MSGKGWDRTSEIGSPWSETDQHTHRHHRPASTRA